MRKKVYKRNNEASFDTCNNRSKVNTNFCSTFPRNLSVSQGIKKVEKHKNESGLGQEQTQKRQNKECCRFSYEGKMQPIWDLGWVRKERESVR